MEKSSYEESIENVQNALMHLENKTFLVHFVLNLLSIVINFFHLIVLTQKTMRTSSINILMSGIAICDIFTMFTWVYKYLSLADLEYPECITATSLIKIYMDVTSWSSQYHFRRTTCWLVIVMASIRYVIMSRISDVRHFKWADPKMGYILIVIVFGASGVLTVIWQWECQVVENRNYSLVANCAEHQDINGNYKFSVTLRPFANLGHYVIFIPCIAFPTLTFLLFRQIQKINETRETIRRNSTTTEDNEEKYVLSVKLIVFITINFFIAEAPIGTIAILKTFLERTDKLLKSMRTSSTNVIMIGIAISDISTMLSTIYKHYFLVDVESPECVTASVRYKIYLDLSAWTFQDHFRRCSSCAMLSIFFVSRNQIVENRAFPLPLNCAEYQDINSRPPFSVILTPLFSSSNFLVLRIFTMFDAIVTKFIPCIAFPCLTVFLIRELRKFHNRVVMNGRKQSVVNGEKNDITTKLIVFMTFAFFIAEAPLGTIYLVKVFSNRDDEILILVYSPAFAGSHTNFMARIADTLTESGHNVTFFVPIFDEARSDQLGVKLTKNIIVMEKSEEMKLDPITVDNITATYWHITVNSKGGHSLFEPVHKLTVQSCRSLFSNSELLETLRAHEYDVGIAEPLMTCSLALFRYLKIEKVILASSCPNYDSVMAAMGEPADTSYVPSIFSEVSGDRMDFADRLENYDMYSFIIERYREDFPDWRELIPDASVHFTNSIPYLDFPRPSIQKTIDIGGISVDLEKIQSETLNGDFDRILDLREKTMFISFGTLAKSSEMPKNYKENLLEVFKSEPNTTFIWKYEHDDVRFAESLENLELVKWAPQTALLNDKRLSAFLSHGGLGSTIETVFLGKPTIMVPIFFDQSRNANMLSRLGTSITLRKTDLGNFDKLKSYFHQILHNDSFRKNAEHVADVIRNQPIKPKELVVKYTEFVGNYGPFHHMTPYSLKMPWIQRYGYDVLLFKIGAILAPVVPIFCDQSRNANMSSWSFNNSSKTDLRNFDKLKTAFTKFCTMTVFEKNAEHVADVIRNQPIKPKELVVKYTEFVGNYGPFHHMTPYSLKMPWFQRYGYDVLLFKIGSFLAPRSEEMKLDPVTMDNVTSSFWNINVNSKEGHSLFDPVHKLTVQSCRSLFSNAELLATLRSHEYDVGISEPMMTCSLALFRHLGIQKTILASSCPNFDVVMAAMGEPAETSYVPAIYSSVSGDRMDFADRLENYDMYHFMVKRYGQVFDDEAKVYRSFLGQDFPDWRELIPDASVHFTNSISYLDFPRPSIQKTIDIGGITVDVAQIVSQKLSNEFNAILDKQEKTMFISFGSMAKSFEMPQNYKENLLEVFKSEPNVTFIWKYESNNVSFAEGLDNLELVKWAPQTTLLNDKRMSAFLSHGGLGSTIETVFFGKPTIMIPIFFDQFRNSHMLSRLGTSVTLLKTDLGNLDKLKSAFHKILHNDSFRKNAEHVADVVRNQPIKPKELVVKYTEFVGK
ncbi:hypothetical protein L5515_007186 [Caenorhabditis briggsae]|uniref:glucuronosyltransferase n=1 Tax=Caenorhabditis briggsae TaxID=6238 RepID=A0AAE9EXR3_CAEBR|nr:hypothetical protein L5515_007186 [Caenorhabditis briggsae]